MRALKLVMATALLCALCAPTWAYYSPFSDPFGPVSMHLSNYDVGTQYYNLKDGAYTEGQLHGTAKLWDDLAGNPVFIKTLAAYDPLEVDPYRIDPLAGPAGEDTWGILRLDQIWAVDSAWNETNLVWNTGDGGWEITAIFWDEHDQGLIQQDVFGSPVQKIWGDTFRSAFFANQPTVGVDDFATAWQAGPTGRPASGNPEYPGVTDSPGAGFTKASGAVPLWTFESVHGTDTTLPATAEFVNTYFPASPPGDIGSNGGAYGEVAVDPFWGAGAANACWLTNPFNDSVNPHDVEFRFTGEGKYDDPTTPGVDESEPGNDWLVSSSDPLIGGVTPELPSSALLLLGMFPVGLAWLRRRKDD